MSANVGQIDLDLVLNGGNLRNQVTSLAAFAAKTFATVFAVSQIVGFTKSCLKLGSDLEEVQNVVDVTFKSMADQVNAFASTAITQLGMSETACKQFMGTYGAMSKAMGFSEQSAYNMSKAITELTGDVSSFYNIDAKEASIKLKSIWTGETETLKDLGVVMTQTNLDAYALANGYGKTTKSMSEMEKVTLRYNYVLNSLKDAQGDFVRTQDSFANQTRILKEQFNALKATIGQALIPVITPVIKWLNALILKLQQAANAFKSFVETIFGKKSESSGLGSIASDLGTMTDNATSASDAVGGIGDSAKTAAKELKGLMGFDEINNLTSTDSNAGGPVPEVGGATDLSSLTDVNKEIDESIAKMAQDVKEIFAKIFKPMKAAWETTGKTVMDNLSYATNGVWELIKSIGRDWLNIWSNGSGQTLCESILNILGNISGIIGDIANSFNTAWNSGNTGKEILQGIFNIINNILGGIVQIGENWRNAWNDNNAGTIMCEAILDAIKGIVDVLVVVSQGLAESFGKATETLFPAVISAVITISEGVQLLAQGFLNVWNGGGSVLADGIIQIVANVTSLAMQVGAQVFKDFANIFELLSPVISDACYMIGTFFKMLAGGFEVLTDNEFAVKAIGLAVEGLIVCFAVGKIVEFATAIQTAGGVMTVLRGAIVSTTIAQKLSAIAQVIMTGATTIWTGVCSLATFATTALGAAFTFLTSPIGLVVLAIGAVIAIGILLYKNWDEVKEFLINTWNSIKEVAISMWEGIKDFFSNTWNGIKDTASQIWGGIKDFLTQWSVDILALMVGGPIALLGVEIAKHWDEIKAKTTEIWENIKTSLSNNWESMKTKCSTTWDNMKDKISSVWNDLKTNSSTTWESIKTTISSKWDELKTKCGETWENIKADFNNIVTFVKTTFSTGWSNAWNGVKNIFQDAFNSLVDIAKKPINAIISMINKLIEGINSLSIDIPDWDVFGDLAGESFGVNIPRIPMLAKGGIIDAPTLACIGEAGKEAVMPLENNTGWISDLATKIAGIIGTNNSINTEQQGGDIIFMLDGSIIGKTAIRELRKMQKQGVIKVIPT